MMKRTILIVKLVMVCSLALSAFAWSGNLAGVLDGGTIEVLQGGKALGIRLLGLDSPERPQGFDENAKRFTASAVTGNKNQPAEVVYHGNVRSRVFHRPGCQHYNCKNCVSNFKSPEEAQRAGYRPCMVCNP